MLTDEQESSRSLDFVTLHQGCSLVVFCPYIQMPIIKMFQALVYGLACL